MLFSPRSTILVLAVLLFSRVDGHTSADETSTHEQHHSVHWIIPSPSSPLVVPQMVQVGDTITFTWNETSDGLHDVYLQNTADCPIPYNNNTVLEDGGRRALAGNDEDDHQHTHGEGSVQLGIASPVQYTFSSEQAGKTVYFSCLVDQHCELGMIFGVQVEEQAVSAALSYSYTGLVGFLLGIIIWSVCF